MRVSRPARSTRSASRTARERGLPTLAYSPRHPTTPRRASESPAEFRRTIRRSSRRHPFETNQLPLSLLVAEEDVDRLGPGWPGSLDAAQFDFHEPAVVARQPARRLEPGRARVGV